MHCRFNCCAWGLLAVAIWLVPGVFVRGDATVTTSDGGTVCLSLNGTWQVAPDEHDEGEKAAWFNSATFPTARARAIEIPGVPTEVFPTTAWWSDPPNDIFWYRKMFRFDPGAKVAAKYYLRFGAVRQLSAIWLNGTEVGTHGGGEDPFEYDVTSLLQPGQTNTIIIQVKQNLLGGIWQGVSLLEQPQVRIIDGFARPDAKAGQIALEVTLENNTSSPAQVEVRAEWGPSKPSAALGRESDSVIAAPGISKAHLILPVPHLHLWDLADPFLYTIKITSDWKNAGPLAAHQDIDSFRTGFRDFRVRDGYFYLNGRRIYLASAHGNQYDPRYGQGSSRDPHYFYLELAQLRKAGFNMMRCIVAAALPEQLDQADETGMLYFTEHETSWLIKDPKQFGRTLNQVVRRDRNHPSLVLEGLLNETDNLDIYQRAKAWLPTLRDIDDTRPVLLSSGRWDQDFKTGSVSNTGSRTWDVYLGGEDPVAPKPTGPLAELGAFKDGTGDAHVYPFFPLTWSFLTAFAQEAKDTHPFFLTESGMGTSYDPIGEEQIMQKLQIPAFVFSWDWIHRGVDGMKHTWATYDLAATYPNMEDMMVDSDLVAARQRAKLFSAIRGNPKINGYNLTSIEDFWGAGEGVMNNFRQFKPGHLEMLRAGWAPLRWCLSVNPTNAYADQPLHLRVTLASEDVLPPGDHPATIMIQGPGLTWKKTFIVQVKENGPLAYPLFDQDVTLPNLVAGRYALTASLDDHSNAAANQYDFTVTTRALLPLLNGQVTVAGVPDSVRDLVTAQGAQLHHYVSGEKIDRETVLVGGAFRGDASAWRALYARAAQGAHVVFLDENVFAEGAVRNRWLAVPAKGDQNTEPEWLYHKDTVAKIGDPVFAGLPAKLMDPDDYGMLLNNAHFFQGVTTPDRTAAVAIRSTLADRYRYSDGVMIGTYRLGMGHFTVNAFDLDGTIGSPAADRLLLNLARAAQVDAAPLAPVPADFNAKLDQLGIVEPAGNR